MIRGSYKTPTTNITLTRVRCGASLLRMESRQECSSHYCSIPIQKFQAVNKTKKEKNGGGGGGDDDYDDGKKEKNESK